MTTASLADRLDDEIRSSGPILVSRYIEAALYDEHEGFYATRGRAGRRGDFLTAPEVGPLFGAVVAAAVDAWWIELGRPRRFDVIEWGAGPGTLARAVIAAGPSVLTSGALTWHLIERSASQRASHPEHAAVRSWPTIEAAGISSVTGVVLANELLDNLPFEVLEYRGSAWTASRIGSRDAEGRFSLVPGEVGDQVEIPPALVGNTPLADDATMPWQPQARAWLTEAIAVVERGRVVVFDYGSSSVELIGRSGGWLRTHRAHGSVADWRGDPGTCDITSDVAFDQLQLDHPADTDRSQAEWLRAHGIEALVAEGRRVWDESASVGDLAALKARSRIRESEALLDPGGMGEFRVMEWQR